MLGKRDELQRSADELQHLAMLDPTVIEIRDGHLSLPDGITHLPAHSNTLATAPSSL